MRERKPEMREEREMRRRASRFSSLISHFSIHSLRLRLLLTMSVVALVAVGSIALLTSRSTTDQFQRYISTDIQRNQQLVSDFLTSYQGNPTMDSLTALVKKLSESASERFMVLQGDGKVLADSEDTLVGQTLDWRGPPPSIFITGGREAGGTITGSVIMQTPVPFTGVYGVVTNDPGAAVPVSGVAGVAFPGPVEFSTFVGDQSERPRGFIPFAVIPAPASTTAQG